MHFTEGCANKIAVPKGKREVVVFDARQPGFGIRKFPDGRAVYIVRYTVAGVRRKLVLSPCTPGVLAKMRKRAADIVAGARLGIDPLAAKQAAIASRKISKERALGALVERFLGKRKSAMKPRYYMEVERHLKRQWKPLHDRDVRTLTRADLVKVIDGIAETSGTTAADRAKASISTFLGWCMEGEHIIANPVGGIAKRSQASSRERVLTEAELVAIWKSCQDDDYGNIVRLLILTGQRREELGSLAWSEVGFDKREIRLPGERTKNKRAHTVPLSDAAAALLLAIPQRQRKLVFGRGEGGFSGWSQCKKRLDVRLGDAVAPWTLHDLRRTFATLSAEHDFASPHIIEAMLNHQSGSKAGIVGVYNRANHERGKRMLADRYGEHLSALVEGRETKVVSLARAG